MPDLSILIPARNEQFLARTIEDILAQKRGRTEIIAVADGYDPGKLPEHPDLQVVRHATSIGQRAATNEAARLSTAEFLMKCDAHCSFNEAFDLILTEPYRRGELADNVTSIPRMYNLHAFDWKCRACGAQTMQGPALQRCESCKQSEGFDQVVIWQPKWRKRTDFGRFDRELHFQYWRDYENREESKGELAEVMCCVGACWMMKRERFWQLDGLDEKHGSWGQMGVEIACKSWLSGGRQIVNKRTWFTHLFRTQPGFGFPYPNPGIKARTYSQAIWKNGKWPKQNLPLWWLIEKFHPIPDWHDPDPKPVTIGRKLTKGIVYYTDNRLEERIAETCRLQLLHSCNGHKIVSVSLRPIDFGTNITHDADRGILTMFRQILAGLDRQTADIVFLAEHDVLYHESHFDFTPPRRDVFYYNENTYKVDATTGQALFHYTKQTSGLCAYRELLIEHYRKRIERVAEDGYSRHMGFEPGCHRYPRGVDNNRAERWMSQFPNIDIRHGQNLTPSRWRQDQFRNPNACLGWKLADEVPGWGETKGRFDEFLKGLHHGA